MSAPSLPSVRMATAAEVVASWPEPYAAPLAELLLAESTHAHELELDSERAGWDRYPPGSLLTALADGVLEDEATRNALGRRSTHART